MGSDRGRPGTGGWLGQRGLWKARQPRRSGLAVEVALELFLLNAATATHEVVLEFARAHELVDDVSTDVENRCSLVNREHRTSGIELHGVSLTDLCCSHV